MGGPHGSKLRPTEPRIERRGRPYQTFNQVGPTRQTQMKSFATLSLSLSNSKKGPVWCARVLLRHLFSPPYL